MLLSTAATGAQLTVTVYAARIVGQKVLVPLALQNNLSEKVESARTVVFLLGEHGKRETNLHDAP